MNEKSSNEMDKAAGNQGIAFLQGMSTETKG